MKYYATREYMPAHAACSLPLIRTRENRPFPGGKMDPARTETGRCNVISIRYPLSAERTFPFGPLPPLPIPVVSIPYLVLPRVLPLHRSGHTLCTARRFIVVGAGRALVARLVFGADRSPLSLRIWPCLGTWVRRERYNTWSMFSLFSDPTIFVPRMRKIRR